MKITFITFGGVPVLSADADPDLEMRIDPPPLSELGDIVVMQVALDQEEEAERYLFQIRKNEDTCLRPVFFVTPPSRPYLSELGNGDSAGLGVLKMTAERMGERARSLAPNALRMGAEVRLASMLYVFDKPLIPLEDPCCAVQYRYPFAEPLLLESEDSMRFIENLHERGMLEGVEILDRVRHCASCWSTQLNYLDVCENCSSLKIDRTVFLHCFTCGFVDAEQVFLENGRLTCPNCHTRLRFLGSDYDKALESYICQDCDTKQIEPRVIARCIRCGHKNAPEGLTPQNIQRFRITPAAEQLAFLGNLDALLSGLEVLDFVPFDYFNYMLKWQLMMHRRHPDTLFGVVGLRLVNLAEQTRKIGSTRVVELIDRLCRELRELVRTTDIVSRSDNTNIWFILPQITPEGGRIVIDRIKKLEEKLELEDGGNLEFTAHIWTPGPKDAESHTVEDVLQELNAALEE